MKIKRYLSLIAALVIILSACTAPVATTQAPPAATEAPPLVTEAPPAATEEAPPLPQPGGANHLVLATTTSTEDSGLLDYLLPDFEKEFGVKVDVIAVGTGQALTLGEDGNADVLLVHARSKEDAFMDAGHGVRREDVMYNDFILVGPESDPAGIKGMTNAAEAFKKMAEAQSVFVSRGDESGTHTKEKAIWKEAGLDPSGDWYVSSGQGMGEVLTMANEQQAYTLSDRATYLARTKEGTELVILVEGDPILFNPYGVITVNPQKNPSIQTDLANKFIDWLISVPVQEKIGKFGVDEFGQSLFIPDSVPWNESQGATAPSEAEAAFKITGKVEQESSFTDEQIKSMETMEVEYTNKKGENLKATGVLLSKLLEMAKPASDATTLLFVANDGYTAEVAIADITSCPNCILAFADEGGFNLVFPGLASSLQVKGVVEIQVK